MKKTVFTPIAAMIGTAALSISTPSIADGHAVDAAAFEQILADDARAADRARDQFRNPAETLAFFGVEPDMTVVEYGPGGGWYTRVLMPYVTGAGKYIAVNRDSEDGAYRDRAQEVNAKSWTERFAEAYAPDGDGAADSFAAFELDEIPEDAVGTADRVLIFRSIHGMLGGNRADTELKALRSLLKDDGMVGVVQHRAPADAPYAYADGSNGYLRQADVIKLFEIHGFELVDTSEINANPKDPANHEGGVWQIPPVWASRDEAKKAIGESDRMTLLFRKVP